MAPGRFVPEHPVGEEELLETAAGPRDADGYANSSMLLLKFLGDFVSDGKHRARSIHVNRAPKPASILLVLLGTASKAEHRHGWHGNADP